jgi:hypothetical protein
MSKIGDCASSRGRQRLVEVAFAFLARIRAFHEAHCARRGQYRRGNGDRKTPLSRSLSGACGLTLTGLLVVRSFVSLVLSKWIASMLRATEHELNENCTGRSLSPSAGPSMVVIFRAPTSRAGTMQEQCAVEPDRASGTRPTIAGDLGAGQLQLLAQGLGEGRARRYREGMDCPVDFQPNRAPHQGDGITRRDPRGARVNRESLMEHRRNSNEN